MVAIGGGSGVVEVMVVMIVLVESAGVGVDSGTDSVVGDVVVIVVVGGDRNSNDSAVGCRNPPHVVCTMYQKTNRFGER